MTLEPYFPRKRGRPSKKETIADRIYKARQEKFRQAEKDEPLSDFEKAALNDYADRMAKPILSIDKEIRRQK